MANEKKLIYAEDLLAVLCDDININGSNLAKVKRHIEAAPAVDAVEVVRCKDCIGKAHWYKNDYGCTICGLSGLFVVEDRDFCPYGERKEGE